MIKRIVEIIHSAYIKYHCKQLCIEQDGKIVGQVPIEDLGILIIAHYAITITSQAITACIKNNTVILFCDTYYLPQSVLLPLTGHSLHTKVIQMQVAVSQPTKKRLWQQIIRQKIINQNSTLELCKNENNPLLKRLAQQIKSGDMTNCEGQAAQIYWRQLFGNNFLRDPNLNGINGALNYGYAIVRSAVARAVCCTGLHPALGIFHCNQYNGLCLADDLMEPFRPWVDRIIFNIYTDNKEDKLTQESKEQLIALLSHKVIMNEKPLPFMVALHHYMASFKRCMEHNERKLLFPGWIK